MKEFIKRELAGWKKLEIAWIVIATIVMLGLSIYWKETVIGIVSALTGIWCVILTGKGKISSYIFGMVNTLLYAYIAYGVQYYGEVMLNALYYLPSQFIGYYLWNKHTDNDNNLEGKKLSLKQSIVFLLFITIGIFGYKLVLDMLDGTGTLLDSASTVISVVANALMMMRYREQWLLWIIIDAITVVMWLLVGDFIMVTMWAVYLINAFYGYYNWTKIAKEN